MWPLLIGEFLNAANQPASALVAMSNETASELMLAAGILVAIIVLLRRSRRKARRQRKRDRDVSQAQNKQVSADASPPLLDAPSEFTRWHVQLHEEARAMQARIDSKLSALQALTIAAREESTRLEAAIEKAERLGLSPCPSTNQIIDQLADGKWQPEPINEPNGGSLDTDGRKNPLTIEETAQAELVHAMADQGCSVTSIAERLGLPIGDVEMLLSIKGT